MKTVCTIRNCTVRLDEPCPKDWEALDPTAAAVVRHCPACRREVFLCESDEATLAHASVGHCIARKKPDSSELPLVMLGRPTVEYAPTARQLEASAWLRREYGIDHTLEDIGPVFGFCHACGFPVTDRRARCKHCGQSHVASQPA